MIATATLWKGKIVLKTDGVPAREFKAMVAKCKETPGARWQKTEKHWAYPASVETCHALRAVWGDDLVVLAPLADWYRGVASERSEHAAMAEASDAELTRLPTLAPRLFAALRPDQRVGAAWVARGYRGGGLLADQPGLGKTLEAIAGMLEADVRGPILVVCPKLSVRPVWLRELRRWTDEAVHIARGTRAQREKAIRAFQEDVAERKFLVIVAEMLRVVEEERRDDKTGRMKKVIVDYTYPELFEGQWAAVVVDESHRLLGSLTVVKGNLMGKGLDRLPIASEATAGHLTRLAMTGTPFGRGGRVQGMFGTLKWLWPDEFTSFWRWAETYFEIEEDTIYSKQFPKGQKTRTVGSLLKGNEDEFMASFGPRILRRTKAEILPNLPPKQYVEVLCELTGQQLTQYRVLAQDAEVEGEHGFVMANGALAEITRAKQVANGVVDTDGEDVWFTGESCKLDALFQKLEDRGILDGSGDMKVIVASQYNEFLKALEERLLKAKVGYHIITGKTSDKKRDKAMAQFQSEGGHRVFLLNAKAGGISITLDAADEVHCLDELWNPEDQEQLEDRAHRASRMHQVTVYHYRGEGTVDQNIAESVEDKRELQHRVLDGRRGLDYARSLIQYRAPKE